MQARPVAAGLIAALALSAAGPALSQAPPSDVTFEVPLNLTRLHSGIASLKVSCTIDSLGFRRSGGTGSRPGQRIGESVITAPAGSVVQTVQVIVPLTESDFVTNASGQRADYECKLLLAESAATVRWFEFRNVNPQYAITPPPTTLSGSFVW